MKKVFLLGGYDLEMIEIKNMLKKYNINYIDKSLKWGAKLSDYKECLNFDGEIYGVELDLDIQPPKNYIEIDHHNENSHKESSLKQVAKILHVELTREQELISANDSNYIKAMRDIGASKHEIALIRSADRKAQGVTQEDEFLGEKSLKESNSNIVYSYTNHFSCVSDAIYEKYNKYTIYNDSKVVFYGYRVLHVKEFLKSKNINEKWYYHGGKESGFVGIKDATLKKEAIENLIKEFQEYEKE